MSDELIFDRASWEAINGFTPLKVFKTKDEIQRWYEIAQKWRSENFYPIYDQAAEGNAFMRLAALSLVNNDGRYSDGREGIQCG